jgi:hypothetical protein
LISSNLTDDIGDFLQKKISLLTLSNYSKEREGEGGGRKEGGRI